MDDAQWAYEVESHDGNDNQGTRFDLAAYGRFRQQARTRIDFDRSLDGVRIVERRRNDHFDPASRQFAVQITADPQVAVKSDDL